MDLIAKIKQILFKPDKFFSALKEKTIQDSLLYYIILLAFNVVMSYLIFLAFGDFFTKSILNMLNLNIPLQSAKEFASVGYYILGYIFGVLFSFAIAAVLFVWLLIFGGNKGYTKAYQLYVYSETPSLLLKWIPFLNFFTWIYDLVLLIIGTKKIYNFSATKAVLIYVIPLTLIFIFLLFMLAASILFLRNTNFGLL